MSTKTTAFYRGNTEISVDFSAEGVSSDGAVVLLDKLERTHKVIGHMAGMIPDHRDSGRVTHSIEKLLRQRVFTLMQGYEDCNDVEHLKNDPLLADILGGKLASQPTLSRFENMWISTLCLRCVTGGWSVMWIRWPDAPRSLLMWMRPMIRLMTTSR